LKTTLVEAAQAAARTKESYMGAKHRRIAARRGKKKATVAVARTILETACHLMIRKTRYKDLGKDYYDKRNPEKIIARLSKRIENLGYKVTVEQQKKAA